MAIQYSGVTQGDQLRSINNNIGTATAGSLVIYSGAQAARADTATSPTGALVTITLPTSGPGPMTIANGTTAAAAVTTLAGTWSGVATGNGTALSWRIFNNTGTVCIVQGGMSDLVLNNTSISSGQTVSVTQFAITAGNF
jgi:hypothetical protein